MKGIHVFFPNKYRNDTNWDDKKNQHTYVQSGVKINPFILHDYDLIVLYLSILNWKKYNGEIELYTTKEGLDILNTLNISSLYDKINTTLIDEQISNYNIDHNTFWASHKLMVLNKLKAPFVIFDLDLYIEAKLSDYNLFEYDIGLFHFEYPGLSYVFPPNVMGYDEVEWPRDWDWDSNPINVAILYFGNQKALEEYTSIALDFMNNNNKPSRSEVFSTRMTFAEQRILGEFVAKTDYTTNCIATGLYYASNESDNIIGFHDVKNLKTAIFKEEDFADNTLHKHSNIKIVEQKINHLWGYKAVLMQDLKNRLFFVSRLMDKAERDFPEHYEALIIGLDKWYKEMK